jgi:branched-subunit amino acid aminotransferase/4-amino-4-deoxychorismate lyase
MASSHSPSVASSSFQIISSLRYDPALPAVVAQSAADSYPDPLNSAYYLLPYHRDRLISAAAHFNWPEALAFLQQDLGNFVRVLDSFIPDTTQPWRLRIVLGPDGACTVDVNPAASMGPLNLLLPSPSHPQSPTSPWRVYIDSQSTTPSAFTTHKTTARDEYTAARRRAGIESPQELAEVLVVNPQGDIMEGSITTPYFRRRMSSGAKEQDSGPEWITPPLSSGGNAGTTRRYALAQGFCVESVITVDELVDGEECWLSNGVRGFMRGVVHKR